MTTESGIKRKLCRDLPREKGEAFEVWVKELLDAGHGEGDEDASWSDTFLGQDPRVAPRGGRRAAGRFIFVFCDIFACTDCGLCRGLVI